MGFCSHYPHSWNKSPDHGAIVWKKIVNAWKRHDMESFSLWLVHYEGSHRSPVDFPNKWSVMRNVDASLMLLIIRWLLCFFSGFHRFILGFDRFIPGFDWFIPASIPVTGPPPTIQRHISQWIVYCFVFWNNLISFYMKWIFFIKQNLLILRTNIFLKKQYSWYQSKAVPVSFQCHRLSTVIHRQWHESVKCCKQHAAGA